MEKQEKKTDAKRGGAQPKDEAKASAKVVEGGKKLKEDMDKLMDEIDDVPSIDPRTGSRSVAGPRDPLRVVGRGRSGRRVHRLPARIAR